MPGKSMVMCVHHISILYHAVFCLLKYKKADRLQAQSQPLF